MRNEINNTTGKTTQYPNLKKDEIQAMDELRKREDLIFTKADKGGALVIMDVEDYVKEADRQLNDKKFYKKLPSDPTKMYAECINNSIDQFKNEGLISELVANGLKTQTRKHQSSTSTRRSTTKIPQEDLSSTG